MRGDAVEVLLLLFVITSALPTGGFVLQIRGLCYTGGSLEDMSFKNTLVFNKQNLVEYDTNNRSFMPCTDCFKDGQVLNATMMVINDLNNRSNTGLWMEEKMRVCKLNAQRFWKDTVQRTSPPTLRIIHMEPVNPWDPLTLLCGAFDFYPMPINITWEKNGKPIPGGMTSGILRPNGDWSFQAQVYLEVTPHPGDAYSCRVEHSSLRVPITGSWAPGLTQVQKVKIGISAAVFILGLLFLLAGFINRKTLRSDEIPLTTFPDGFETRHVVNISVIS